MEDKIMNHRIVNVVTGEETIIPFSAEEEKKAIADKAAFDHWGPLRDQRNRLLTETDWWAVSDRSMTTAQTKYRQDLRDLPANTSDPANPTWPTKP